MTRRLLRLVYLAAFAAICWLWGYGRGFGAGVATMGAKYSARVAAADAVLGLRGAASATAARDAADELPGPGTAPLGDPFYVPAVEPGTTWADALGIDEGPAFYDPPPDPPGLTS